MQTYKVIGLMSGTSLDGLDIAYCEFSKKTISWSFSIIAAQCIPYTKEWESRLSNAYNLSGLELTQLNADYGILLGEQVNKFILKNDLKPDFIASHGHTVFHQPDKNFSLQIGHAAAIAAKCLLPVIADFRSLDVFMGGQGAPLVPIGDELLFPQYEYCLNIGGIANISQVVNKQRKAHDICAANMVLNELSMSLGHAYDKDGALAKSGKMDSSLLKQLDRLNYYSDPGPKSLGKEWVVNYLMPIISNSPLSTINKLATYTEHIALKIAGSCKESSSQEHLLITGGGAHNKFLVERIKAHTKLKVIIPDSLTIDYKEALIFAFLGVLRMRNEINCLGSVTGGKDHSAGAIYQA